jgi:hypothetical protein
MVLIEARSSNDSAWREGKRQEDAGIQRWGEEEFLDFTKGAGARAKTRVSSSDNLMWSGPGKSAPWLVL